MCGQECQGGEHIILFTPQAFLRITNIVHLYLSSSSM